MSGLWRGFRKTCIRDKSRGFLFKVQFKKHKKEIFSFWYERSRKAGLFFWLKLYFMQHILMQHMPLMVKLKIANLQFILVFLLSFLIPHSTVFANTNQECDYRIVSKVIDGDTFELTDGSKIRLIGVDTPETVDPRIDVEWFGKEAARKSKEWVEGEKACFKQDRDKTMNTDKYGRLLRYVWRDSFFVNAELIKQGYGFAYARFPFEYLEDFKLYERNARENNKGLWNKEKQKAWEEELEKNKAIAKTCSTPEAEKTICPEDAINYIGKHRTVRFFVRKSYDSGKAVFLNSKNNFKDPDNFTAVIFEADKNNFPTDPADFYWGKTIDVTGKIKKYKKRAEIILKDSSQIKILSEK